MGTEVLHWSLELSLDSSPSLASRYPSILSLLALSGLDRRWAILICRSSSLTRRRRTKVAHRSPFLLQMLARDQETQKATPNFLLSCRVALKIPALSGSVLTPAMTR